MGYFLIPPEDLSIVARWVKIDYDYDHKTSERNWKLHKDSTLHVEIVPKDFLTALQVTQVLEK